MKTILIIDDEETIRESLIGILSDEGFRTIYAQNGEDGLDRVREESPDLVLLDIWMPGIDGIETLRRIKEERADQMVIMMSGHGTIETAVKATKYGAYDFIEKPLSLEKVLLGINNALQINKLVSENRSLKKKIAHENEMIGTSTSITQLKDQLALLAPSSGWALITGENGTGKELVARSIHTQSNRAQKPFIEVNCAAIPEELIESELFGHEKGAFTGATTMRKGKFDQAHEGTLFLDEIADMSLKTQAKVLRILQERKFERVGGTRTIEVDVRVIAATNKDLIEAIGNGSFREDLYYRLNVVPLAVPPLRERKADIPALAKHFIKFFCGQESRKVKVLHPEVIDALTAYDWPGNVRELKNMTERLVIMTRGDQILPENLPSPLGIGRSSGESPGPATGLIPDLSFKEAKEYFEKRYLEQKLAENEGNISRTAEQIGLERSNLHRKIKTYGIDLNK